jgi:hypothetical protein
MNMLLIMGLIIFFLIYSNICYYNENFYIGVRDDCDHVSDIKNKYKESYHTDNMRNGFDCYNDCIKNHKCEYVGIGFDCYNNCFDNVDMTERNNDTLFDNRQ